MGNNIVTTDVLVVRMPLVEATFLVRRFFSRLLVRDQENVFLFYHHQSFVSSTVINQLVIITARVYFSHCQSLPFC